LPQKPSKYSEYSFSKFLRSNNKSSDEFEFMLNNLSLEEVIALKLELSAKTINGKLYGFYLWNNINKIVRESVVLFAVSSTRSLDQAQALLGLKDHIQMKKLVRRYRESLRYYGVFDLKNRRYLKNIIGKPPKKDTN
jgi:di/tripeptidase